MQSLNDAPEEAMATLLGPEQNRQKKHQTQQTHLTPKHQNTKLKLTLVAGLGTEMGRAGQFGQLIHGIHCG